MTDMRLPTMRWGLSRISPSREAPCRFKAYPPRKVTTKRGAGDSKLLRRLTYSAGFIDELRRALNGSERAPAAANAPPGGAECKRGLGVSGVRGTRNIRASTRKPSQINYLTALCDKVVYPPCLPRSVVTSS
jgi:hypothetical protein